MALKKLTWKTAQKATLVQPAPAPQVISLTSLDLGNPKVRWLDDPNGQRLWAMVAELPRQVQIMGTGTPTAYDPAWTDAAAIAALEAALALPASTTATPGSV